MRRKQAVFVDTVGWIALVHRRDELHEQTVEVYHTLRRLRRVTTDAVLVESCNSFSKTTMDLLKNNLYNYVGLMLYCFHENRTADCREVRHSPTPPK